MPALYGRYRQELLAFVRRTVGRGPPEPEDIVQQAFLNFVAQPPAEEVANPRAYLYRTAHNLALNYRERERVRRKYIASTPDPKAILEARPDWDPEHVLVDSERHALVKAAIRALPRRRRLYLLMNRVEGLSCAEIGRRVGLSESVVRKQVMRAVRECSEKLRAAEMCRSGR